MSCKRVPDFAKGESLFALFLAFFALLATTFLAGFFTDLAALEDFFTVFLAAICRGYSDKYPFGTGR